MSVPIANDNIGAVICPNSPVDQGIAGAVQVLRDGGVETFESCEGGEGHAFPDPTVKFHGTGAAGWRALAVCRDFSLPVRELMRVWDVKEGEPCGPYWMLVFAQSSRLQLPQRG